MKTIKESKIEDSMMSTQEMPPPPKRTCRRLSHSINGKNLTSRKGGFTGMEIPVISFLSRSSTGQKTTTQTTETSTTSMSTSSVTSSTPLSLVSSARVIDDDEPISECNNILKSSNNNNNNNRRHHPTDAHDFDPHHDDRKSQKHHQKVVRSNEETAALEATKKYLDCAKQAKEVSEQQHKEANSVLHRAQLQLEEAQEAYQCAQMSKGRSVVEFNDALKQNENAQQYVAKVIAATEKKSTTTIHDDEISCITTDSSFAPDDSTTTSSTLTVSQSEQQYAAQQYHASVQSRIVQAKMAKENAEIVLKQSTQALHSAQRAYNKAKLATGRASVNYDDALKNEVEAEEFCRKIEDPFLLETLQDHAGPVTALTAVDENRFLSCSQDKTIKVWSLASKANTNSNNTKKKSSIEREQQQQQGKEQQGSSQCFCIDTYRDQPSTIRSISTIGNDMFVCSDTDKERQGLALWEVASGEPLDWFPGHSEPVLAVARIDKKSFVSSSKDYTIRLWTLESSATSIFIGHGGPVWALSPVLGQQFISGSTDSTVKLWDLPTGLCVRTFRGHGGAVLAVKSFGKFQFLSGSADQCIKLFDLLSGQCIRTFDGHTGSVTSLAAINDYKFLSASNDKTIKLWNSTTGECLYTYRGHTESINSIIYMGHGKFASCSNDGTIKIWKIPL